MRLVPRRHPGRRRWRGAANWRDISSNWNGLTVGDLFDRIRKTMPQGSPGKLTRQQDADILAYLLSFNKFPAGKTELQKQVEFLKEIRFEATKPDTK